MSVLVIWKEIQKVCVPGVGVGKLWNGVDFSVPKVPTRLSLSATCFNNTSYSNFRTLRSRLESQSTYERPGWCYTCTPCVLRVG